MWDLSGTGKFIEMGWTNGQVSAGFREIEHYFLKQRLLIQLLFDLAELFENLICCCHELLNLKFSSKKTG